MRSRFEGMPVRYYLMIKSRSDGGLKLFLTSKDKG